MAAESTNSKGFSLKVVFVGDINMNTELVCRNLLFVVPLTSSQLKGNIDIQMKH